jgi:hypothetical protein
MPEFSAVRGIQGFTYGELTSSGVGNTGAITCMTGWTMPRAVPRYRCPNNEKIDCYSPVRTPCEWLLMDLLVRNDLVDRPRFRTAVFSGHEFELPNPNASQRLDHLFPAQELGVHIGCGPTVTYSPHVPRIVDMVRFVFDRLGWEGSRFDVYRCCLSYPVMPSMLRVRSDMPERP